MCITINSSFFFSLDTTRVAFMFGCDHSNIITARFEKNHVSHNYYLNSTRVLVDNARQSRFYSQTLSIAGFEPKRSSEP